MSDNSKEAMLNAAANIGKFYAFLAQGLRTITDPQVSAQLPDGILDAQLAQIRADLAPILENNHVVRENLEKVDREVTRIRKAAQDPAKLGTARQEAEKYLPEVSERARTVSDLVGLFRRF